tara:strand:- start:75 stop:254 length:180 start_codon:yes stop_codon:yes gene_type:complete
MKKVDDFETVYDMIEHALEFAYQGKMQLKFYEFLKYRKTKKNEVDVSFKVLLQMNLLMK